MTGKWAGSTRKSQLPADWPRIRRLVLEHHHYACRAPGCGEWATDVDHIIPGHDHSAANLRPLCAWHHRQKSAAEGGRSGTRYYRKRREEKHPGIVNVKKQRTRPQAVRPAPAAQ